MLAVFVMVESLKNTLIKRTLGIFSRKTSSSQKFAMHLGQQKTTQAYKKIQDGVRE